MTGAGFGGCAVALVSAERAESFATATADTYRQATSNEPSAYICQPTDGAALIE